MEEPLANLQDGPYANFKGVAKESEKILTSLKKILAKLSTFS